MRDVFTYRFERFNAMTQVVLGVLAFAIALTLGAFIPAALPSLLVTLFVLTPLSIYLVVAVASSVQRARNTVRATELDTVLHNARQVHHEVPQPHLTPPGPTPAWRDALIRIEDQRERVMATGRVYCVMVLVKNGDVAGVILPHLKGKPEFALVDREIKRLAELQARHSGVGTAQATHQVYERIYALVGKAMTGVDVEAMAALVELDRDFVPFTDCQVGHWDVHNLDGVYTVPGGQRRVKRSCSSCDSRWSEKI